MKRKLSLFLALCLLVGAIAPAAEVQAAGASEPVLQMEEMTGEMAAEDIGDIDETAEENCETEDDAQVSVNQTEETTQTDSEEEIVSVEESEDEEDKLTSEEAESLPRALQTEGFESSYGADNTVVAVTSYAYGADLLVVQRDGSYSSGMMAADGVIIVEADAGVDLVSYVGKMSNPVADSYEPKELVVGTVTASATEYPVRYINLEGTDAEIWSEYANGWHYIKQFSLNSLEPEKTYEYLFVSYNYIVTDGSYEFTFLPIAKANGEGEAVERILTTKAAPTGDELLVQAGQITSGYSQVGATVQLSGLNGRRIVEAGLKAGEQKYYTTRCSSEEKILVENLPPECTSNSITYNAWKEESEEFIWYFSTGETTVEVIPYVAIEEYKDGEIQEKTFYGNPVTISTIDITELTVANQEIGYITSNTVAIWKVRFSPASFSENRVYLCYKTKDAGEYTRYDAGRTLSGGSYDWTITGLLSETEYQYCFEITDDYGNNLVFLDGGSFTTAAAPTELSQEDIPDSVLWTYLLGNYGSEGKLTTDDLLKVTYLSISTSSGTVTDLKGIEYVRYLRECNLQKHGVTDEGILPLLSCMQLTNINLIDNELTTMPDFSDMTKLTELKVKGNQIPAEEITGDKYPEGVDTDDFWPQYYSREISLAEETVCKDATENGTYGVSLKVTGVKSYASSIGLKITDITNGDSSVLYENNAVSCSYKYVAGGSQYYVSYTLSADVSEVAATEGSRSWEIICTAGNETITDVLTVIVDPDGIGGFQVVPESILPKALSDYWAERNYDLDQDGKISFNELAKIGTLYIGADYGNSLQLETYAFLPYMTNLQAICLHGEDNFTQESLEVLASLKSLWRVELKSTGTITDISSLKSLPNLQRLVLSGMSGMTGLAELKKLPIRYLNADPGTFTDAEIFEFICNKTEEGLTVGACKSLVSELISPQSVSEVQVSVIQEGIINYSEENPFLVCGIHSGETQVTYTLGDSSHTIHVTVTGEDWNPDPELGTVVEESKRMRFAGTEGVENARVSRSMVDEEGNIWNISTRTPEKILEDSDYTKYAARIIYDRTTRFSVVTNTANVDYSFYLDEEGTLWVYNRGYKGDEDNFSARYEVMSDVADWQEGGYSEMKSFTANNYILILRTDGSLWYYSFDSAYDSGVFHLSPLVLDKLEDGGVTGVYPYSYLKDGCLYRVNLAGEKELLAKDIIKVWDNTSVILAQDASGNYYSLQDSYRGKLEMTGEVKEFLVGSFWDPEHLRSTERDMIAGYLLMDNGTLYRTEWSRSWYAYARFAQLDTNVTALEKDYYWKGDTAYWFSGEPYADYIGNGIGKGLYPVWEKDEISGINSITLYVNGIKYLTKVSDWTVGDECIYAVRLDNTLWQFDEDNVPQQVDVSALGTTLKDTKVNARDIDILDLIKTEDNVTVKWTEVEGAVSYQLDVSYGNFEDWSITDITETEYTVTPINGTNCYYQIRAVDAAGEVLATSWKFRTDLEEPSVEVPAEMKLRLLDAMGTETIGNGGTYSLAYHEGLKGQTLLLNVTVEGVENAELTATSSDSSVAEAAVNGSNVELKITGEGITQITVTELQSGYVKSIQLYLKDCMPRPVSDIVEINRGVTEENVVRVTLADNTRLTKTEIDTTKLTSEEIEADYVNYFTAALVEGGIRILLDDAGRSSKLPNGNYRLPIKVEIEDISVTNSLGETVKIENVPLILTVKISTSDEDSSIEIPVKMKFQMLDSKGTEIVGDEGIYSLVYHEELKGQTLLLSVTVEGVEDAKLAVASSDSSVAEAAVNGQSIKLKITGKGTTRITVTEQQSGYEESIQLCLKDYMPKLVSDMVEINRTLSMGSVVRLNLADNTRLTKIEVDLAQLTSEEIEANYVNYFTVALTENSVKIVLDDTGRSSRLSNGTYRLPLKASIEGFSQAGGSQETVKIEAVPLALTVKISNSVPKISVKATENINLFYTDTWAAYQLTASTGEIVNAEFVPKSGSISYFTSSYDHESGKLVLMPKTGSDGKTLWDLSSKELSKALSGQLNLTMGEKILTQKLTIKKSTAKPTVTLTETSRKVYKFTEEEGKEPVYAGKVINFQPIDKKTKVPFKDATVTLTGYESKKNGKAIQCFSPGWNPDGTEKDYVLTKDADGRYTIYFVGQSSATATLKVQEANWTEPVFVKCNVSVTSAKMTGKLSASKVTLNKQYVGDQKTLVLSTNIPYADFTLGNWEVIKLPKGTANSQGLEVKKGSNGLSFALREGSKAELKEGTYTIRIPVTFHFEDGISYTPAALNVKVNVLNEKLTSRAVKWKTSGKLDVIARESSEIIAIPAISKLNAEVVAAAFSQEDIRNGLDQKLILGVESGKLSIQLKPGTLVSMKDKYAIHPVLTVQTENGESHLIAETPKITVKPTQSQVKITLDQKSLTMYKGSAMSQTQAVTYTLKGAEGVTVERVESGTNGFTAQLLEDGRIKVSLSDTSLREKTYGVKLNVYLTDQASNKKPISMNVKVVLKK